jgi:asparagine synthase (glutamine-hydrolysing)
MRAPFLDHRFVAAVLALPETERFTTPSRQLFTPVLAPLADRAPFTRKKRGFNPPIAGWLEGDLAPRLPGLGARLAALTSGQLVAARVDALVAAWRGGAAGLGEQILQLVILDESLSQLATLAAEE